MTRFQSAQLVSVLMSLTFAVLTWAATLQIPSTLA